jgi:hypothetical protein
LHIHFVRRGLYNGIRTMTSWWSEVDCPPCFLGNGTWQSGHRQAGCTSSEGQQAYRLSCWLEDLNVPLNLPGQGSCTFCQGTNSPCVEIRIKNAMSEDRSPEEKAALRDEYASKTGKGRHCEHRPRARDIVASLCACDQGFFADCLSKTVCDEDGVQLWVEADAHRWFQQHVPMEVPGKTRLIPRLLLVLGCLTDMYYFHRNYNTGLPPAHGFPARAPGFYKEPQETRYPDESSLPGSRVIEPSPQLIRWRACLDWWEFCCAFSYSRGFSQRSYHTLDKCDKGGADLAKRSRLQKTLQRHIEAFKQIGLANSILVQDV